MHEVSWLPFLLFLTFSFKAHAQVLQPAYQNKGVIVPALVEGKSGHIAYDLAASGFSIRDDGIQQQIKLRKGTDTQLLSLLIVIQTGDQAAIITFNSRFRVLQGFTVDPYTISRVFESLTPRDVGASLFDALHLAMTLSDKTPIGNRRAVLLISGEQNHGNYASDCSFSD